jgi:hypothetical protein
MDDKLIEKLNLFVKSKCSRVPHNIGLDILKIVEKHKEQLALGVVSKSVTAKTGVCKKCQAKALETYIDGKECTSCGYVC